MRSIATASIFALLVAACAQVPLQGPWSVIDDPASEGMAIQKIVAAQKALEKPTPNFDRVIVLRMLMEGQRVEVTSIAPSSIVAEPARGNLTIFNIGDRKTLILFTRDGKNIKGYRREIPLAELQPGATFRFPVAQDPGVVVEREFVVDKVIEQ
jgi:hypothetical protein